MFEDLKSVINLLIVPKYDYLIGCRSIDYVDGLTRYSSKRLEFTFFVSRDGDLMFDIKDILEELRTIYRMLDKDYVIYYSVVFSIDSVLVLD